jgi:hypothetical protein
MVNSIIHVHIENYNIANKLLTSYRYNIVIKRITINIFLTARRVIQYR